MNDSNRDYSDMGIKDLLDDDAFIRVVTERERKPGIEEWEALLLQYPEKQEIMEEAAGIIRYMNQPESDDEESKNRVWANIAHEVRKEKRTLTRNWYKVAIAVLILSGAGITGWHIRSHYSRVRWQTGKIESRKINLPDSSVIMIGNSSSLAYGKARNKDFKREVWLTGEAHFEIKHLNVNPVHITNEELFTVHVNNELDIEVLGTVFNVKKELEKITVELESGSVKITRKGNNPIILKPGEKATLDKSNNSLLRFKHIEDKLQNDWQNNSIELNNTPVSDIIDLIEKTYHKKVIVNDQSILSRRIDGSFPLYNEKDTWFMLSNILDIDVEIRAENLLVLRKKQ